MMQFGAGFVVATIFGSEVAGSAAILTVHIWASIFIFMRAVFSRWLIAEDLPRFSLATHVAGAVMNIALNLWWIPSYGALGAAYATLVSYSFASWITLYLHPRTRPIAHMMARSLCLPVRWSALRAYWHEWRRGF
jgi:O-antigen/teichoic acid export membrane protein